MSLPNVGSALKSTLSAGTALTGELGGTAIYDTVAPQGTSAPYVVYAWSGGGTPNDGANRDYDAVWLVKGVTTDQAQARRIDDAIDDLLHDGTLTATGWNNYWCAREADVRYAEPATGGLVYWHYGGRYRVRFSKDTS